MKEIPLTKGKVALVDDADYERLSQWKWYASKTTSTFYASRNSPGKHKKQMTLKMHRVILAAKKNEEIDHKNGNGLDNRRENLRKATHSQNLHNCSLRRNNTSGYNGVSFYYGKWRAEIYIKNKRIKLGYYDEKIDAARAYNEAAKKYCGNFARLNIIQ